MKPYVKKLQSSQSSASQKSHISKKLVKWEAPFPKKITRSSQINKIIQSSFTCSSETLSSFQGLQFQYKQNKKKLAIKNTANVKLQFVSPKESINKNDEVVKQVKNQQELINEYKKNIIKNQHKICKVLDMFYMPEIKHIQPSSKKYDDNQDSLLKDRTKSTSDIDYSNSKNQKQQLNQQKKPRVIKPLFLHKQQTTHKKKYNDQRYSKTKSKSKSNKQSKDKVKKQHCQEDPLYNIDVLKNCRCCGKLITKLCFRCPHIYCNADNCSRKKKQLLNQRMLTKMKQDKIQQHYRQRQIFEQRNKMPGSTRNKPNQQCKKVEQTSEQQLGESDELTNQTNQLCGQSSQDQSSEKTLMFLKKNQKKKKKVSKLNAGLIKNTKAESNTQSKRSLRKISKNQLFEDSDQK